jgi:hypothetical protein
MCSPIVAGVMADDRSKPSVKLLIRSATTFLVNL